MSTSGSDTGGDDVFDGKARIFWWLKSQDPGAGAHGRSTILWAYTVNWASGDNCHRIEDGKVIGNGVTRWSDDLVHVFNSAHVHTGDWPDVNSSTGAGFAHATYTIDHDSSGNASVVLSGSHHGSSGPTSTASGTWSLPNIPPTPSAPGTPSVTGHDDSNPTTATFSWSTPSQVGTGLVDYQLQVDNSSGFGSPNIDTTDSWTTSHSVSGLAKNTTYYARVRASSASGFGPYSGTRSFTTGTTVPGAPGAPSVGTVDYTTISLSWSTPSDDGGLSISSYTVERATNSSFTTNLVTVTGIDQASHTSTGMTAGTTYWFRVKAVNSVGTGSASSSTLQATLTAEAPEQPAAPTFTDVAGISLTVNWVAPATNGAPITSYTVERSITSGTAGFGNAITGISSSARSVQVTDLDYGTQYWFRVIAVSSAGSTTGVSDDVTTGSTVPFAPLAPTVSDLTQVTALVSYVAPDDGGSTITGYDVQRAFDSAFTQTVVTTPDTVSPLTLSGLLPAVEYFVRVRAKNINGTGAWSPSTSFTPLPSIFAYLNSVLTDCQVYVPVAGQFVLCTTQTWNGSEWV